MVENVSGQVQRHLIARDVSRILKRHSKQILPFNPSMHPSLYPSIHPSIHGSVHPFFLSNKHLFKAFSMPGTIWALMYRSPTI